MTTSGEFEIFLVAAPGLEPVLWAEARAIGFKTARYVPGGVTMTGGWPDVWRANLELRGAGRVLARIGAFKATHLAELDKISRRFPWGEVLRADIPFRVDATCKRSRIYHSGAAAERIETAIRRQLGAASSPDAEVCIKARFEDDICTIGIDTSGDLLHKRGHKEAVAKAPMRETMASLFLRQCGFDGCEPVLDPMCGSGTFVIEAAEISAGLKPGRSRRFAFEYLATFDPVAWHALRDAAAQVAGDRPVSANRFYGSDRDAGAIAMSVANAERAGVSALTTFQNIPIARLIPPEGRPGLVITNPPYGDRIGDRARITDLYRSLGQTLMRGFHGWRAAIVTTDARLAKSTGLPFNEPSAPVSHGGLRVTLYQTDALP